jgi:hypothetical protein
LTWSTVRALIAGCARAALGALFDQQGEDDSDDDSDDEGEDEDEDEDDEDEGVRFT